MSTPPVSMRRKRFARHSQISSLRSRVTPDVSWTTAARVPVSRLTSVDFPTFGKPTIATVPMSSCSDIGCKPARKRRTAACQEAGGTRVALRGRQPARAGGEGADLAERAEGAVGGDPVSDDVVVPVVPDVQEAAV